MGRVVDQPVKGSDYSGVTSKEAALGLVARGELVAMLLVPELFGGDARPENVVYVPPFAAELKARADDHVRSLAMAGKVIEYTAQPTYAGKSWVPVSVTVHAYAPDCDVVRPIIVWRDAAAD